MSDKPNVNAAGQIHLDPRRGPVGASGSITSTSESGSRSTLRGAVSGNSASLYASHQRNVSSSASVEVGAGANTTGRYDVSLKITKDF